MSRVVIVDDHLVLAESLALELERRGIPSTVVDPDDADAVERMVSDEPDACLIDLDLGEHRARGLRFLERAVAARISAAMFTGTDDEVALGRCIGHGASGVISKSLPFAEVVERVERLLGGEQLNSDSEKLRWVLAEQAFDRCRRSRDARFGRLTQREVEVLAHLLEGRSAEEIAEADYVSLATARSHIRAVLRKLGVHSQLAAVAEAHRAGWAPS